MLKYLVKNNIKIYILAITLLFSMNLNIAAQESNTKNSNINVNKTVIINKNNDLFNIDLDEYNGSKDIKSLMFSDKDFRKIEEALIARSKNRLIKKKVGQSKAEKRRMAAHQSMLYLESILYLSESRWAAWVSGSKINSDNNSIDQEIYIKDINQDSAVIIWNIGGSKWRFLTEGQKINKDKYKINKKTNKANIVIKLKINQRFSLLDDKIFEGDVKIETEPQDENLEIGEDTDELEEAEEDTDKYLEEEYGEDGSLLKTNPLYKTKLKNIK